MDPTGVSLRQFPLALGQSSSNNALLTLGGFLMRAVLFATVLAMAVAGHGFAQTDKEVQEAPVVLTKEALTVEKLDPLPAARKLFREGHYDQAANAYRALMKSGGNPSAAAGLTQSLVRMDDMAGANEVVKKALKDFPDEAVLHEANGEALYRSGALWDAEVEFANTINKWGPNAQAYLWLSRIYSASAFHKKSRTMLERAYKIDPDDPEVAEAYRRATRQLKLEDDASETHKAELAAMDEPVRQLLEQMMHRQHLGCRSVTAPNDAQVPLLPLLSDAQHLHGFGLEMTFNGQKGKLLLDTGAGGILINRRLAERAGVKRLASSKVEGIGDKGGTSGYLGHLDVIKMGPVELHDCIVEVSERRNVLDDDGLIGTNLFQDYLVEIDFPHTKFKLSALPARPEGVRKEETKKGDSQQDGQAANPSTKEDAKQATIKAAKQQDEELFDPYRAPELQNFSRMYRVGHYLLVPTAINNLTPKLFLLDTGAFNNTISPAAAREVTKVRGDEDFIIKGLSGTVKNVYTADQATLTFSHYRQKNQEMVAFDLSGVSKSAGMEVAGTLGFAMLRLMDIKIDYRDGMIDFYYDAKAFPWLR
jgi:tetratricopeptide (TPR) repeat protein